MEMRLRWFDENRKSIGYTIGALNILQGLSYLFAGHFAFAGLWLIVGGVIVIDTWEYKNES
jgi:hypothetical protein